MCEAIAATEDDNGFWEVPAEARELAQQAALGDPKWEYLYGNVDYVLDNDKPKNTPVEGQRWVRATDNIVDVCEDLNGLDGLPGWDRGFPGYDDGPEEGGPPLDP